MTPTRIKGLPNLVVEILSPSTSQYDLVKKREKYEAAGIGEYWMVDPDEQQVSQLVLREGRYVETVFSETVSTRFAPQATVDLAKVW
jgi:Uma2 family endonuclease